MATQANKLRFVIVRRPGIYNTHSQVIQPPEHTMVNDGLPLLMKQFKTNITTLAQTYLPQYESIEFDEVDFEDVNESHSSSIVLNHPKQFGLSAFNMKQLYVAISEDEWKISPSTKQYFGEDISTCLDWQSEQNNECNWMKHNNADLINESNITLRGTFKRYSQYITYLRHEQKDQELILFHSNHLSVPLSRQIGKIIKNWQPDKVILESDSIRINEYIQLDGTSKFLNNLSDIGIAVSSANKNIATHIVLADWNIAQYRIMLSFARCLDKMQSKDAIDSSTNISLHVFAQLFCPSLLPTMKHSLLDEYYGHTMKINNPHLHCLYQKRNDIFANTINNCDGKRMLGIFGHSHINPISKRLSGHEIFQNPFQDLGSHNIRF